MAIIYLNGRYLAEERARIPATDPALSWGVGLFEVVRGYNRQGFQLKPHMARLMRSAKHFGIDTDLPDLERVVTRLFERNDLDGGYVRITLTGGGNLIVVVHAWKAPPKSLYARGGRLAVASFRRDPGAPLSGHKTLNYLENMRARWAAEEHGVIDALVLGMRGEVLEGTRCNIFAARRGKLYTPALAQSILPGVTRQLVIDLALEQGIEVSERRFKLKWLLESDEVFITSTMMEVVPVIGVAEDAIAGPGVLTRELMKAYRKRTCKECPPCVDA